MPARLATLAALAAILFIGWGYWRGAPHDGAASPPGGPPARSKPSPTDTPLSSRDASARLQALLRMEQPLPEEFSTLERLAQHLHPVELFSLLSGIDGEEPLGAKAWIRCALTADLARRDSAAALEFVNHPPFEDADEWVERQLEFSLYRGWAKSDPAAALAHLLEHDASASREDEIARESSARAIFAAWVRIDPDTAWRSLADWPSGSDIPGHAVIAGFFQGLPPIEFPSRTGMLAAAWRGREAEERARHLEVVSHVDRWSVLPRDEHSPLHVAAAWARYDPDAALAWLDRCELPGRREDRQRAMFERWASESPASAVEWMLARRVAGETLDPTAATGLFLGLAFHDPDLGAPLLDDLPSRTQAALLDALPRQVARPATRDYLPGLPGTRRHLPALEWDAALARFADGVDR